MPEYDPPKGQPRNPSYGPYAPAGGGGAGGTYIFTDLAELDAIIAGWKSVRDRIGPNSQKLFFAVDAVYAPADDDASGRQAERLVESLTAAQKHNESVFLYAKGYVERLEAVRAEYAGTEQANTDQFTAVDEYQ